MPRIALLLLLLLPAPAHAQGATSVLGVARDALAMGEPGRALELARIARGMDEGAAPEALVLMGRCLIRLERPAAAQRLFRRALEDATDELIRGQAAAGIVRANQRLATIRLDVHPVGANVTVDGEPLEWERGQRIVLLPVGQHEIRASTPGREARIARRHFGADGLHEVHLVLPEGDETREGLVHGPDARSPTPRWYAGDLIQTGIGLVGIGASAAWLADANGRLGGPDGAGARLELFHGHYELGVSLGLAATALGHAGLFDANGGHSLGFFGISLATAMLGAGVAVGFVGLSPRSGSSEAAFAGGMLMGGAASTFGNLLLGRHGHIAVSLATTLFGVAASQFALAFSTAGSPLPGAPALTAYEAELPSGVDACERIRAGDSQQGAFLGQMSILRATCAERASVDTTFGVSMGMALGSGALGLATAAVMTAAGDDGDALDFTVAAGPSSLSMSGRF